MQLKIFYVNHPLAEPIIVYKGTVVCNDKNEIRLETESSRYYIFQTQNHTQLCFLEVDKSYHISFFETPQIQFYFQEGTSNINNAIYEFGQLYANFKYKNKSYYEWNTDEFVEGITASRNNLETFLNKKYANLPEYEKKILTTHFDNVYTAQILNFGLANYNPYIDDNIVIPSFFIETKNNFKIDVIDLEHRDESYQIALQSIGYMKASEIFKGQSREKLFANPDDMFARQYSFFDESNYSEEIRSFFLAEMLYKGLITGNIKILSKYLTKYYSDYPTSGYYEGVNEKFIRLNNLELNNAPPLPVLNLHGEKFELSDKYIGKAVYLDFWATWCGPCIKEIPIFEKIKEEYKGNQNIVFIKISIDQDVGRWKNFEEKKSLSRQDSYIIDEDKRQEIWDSYLLSSVPRYILIDKQGKIINANAPRPSDPKIREILDGLLEEK